MSESNKALVETRSLDIRLQCYLGPDGSLQLEYDGKPLSRYGNRLEVECDAVDVVTFRLSEFVHDRKTWSVTGTPRLPTQDPDADLSKPWMVDQVVGYMESAVEILVTASAEGEAANTQKIYAKTKPRTSLPDPQMG